MLLSFDGNKNSSELPGRSSYSAFWRKISEFRVQGAGFRVQGSGFRVQGPGSRVQGSGFRVRGANCRAAAHTPHSGGERDWYFIAKQPAPALHLTNPERCAALRIVLATVPQESRSCEHIPDGFDHILHPVAPPGSCQVYGITGV